MEIGCMFSIITPCYNSQETIKQTIESVISQTYTNWELLICDDCSTDKTSIIIEEYTKQDYRIKYLKTEINSGSPSLPRNMCLDNSRGKYVAFLDSDDVWLPNKLEEQLSFIEKNSYSFIYSNYEKISFNGKRNNRVVETDIISTYKSILASNSIPCLTAVLKKELIGNIRFRDTQKEDFIFWLDVLRGGEIAYNTNRVHALYRETKNSRSGNKFKMLIEQWNILRNVEKLTVCHRVFLIFRYTINGLIKYLK